MFRGIRKEEQSIKSDDDGDDSIDDEHPSPSSNSMGAIQSFQNSALEISADHGPDIGRAGEDGGPLSEFCSLVPGSEDILNSDEGRSFEKADEEANWVELQKLSVLFSKSKVMILQTRTHLVVACDFVCENCQDGPSQFTSG